jgi:hypothetical protein
MILKMRIFFRLVYLMFTTVVIGKPLGVFIKTCGLCEGFMHTRLESSDDKKGNYNAKFQCERCGAIGDLQEHWSIRELSD